MTRMWALVSLVVGLTACAEAPAELIVPFGQSRFAVTSPGLIAPLESLLVLLFPNGKGDHPCSALVEEGPVALHERAPSALQLLGVEGGALVSEHTFGQIAPETAHSVVLLGSLRSRAQLEADAATPPLQAARGSVIAIGCEEFEAGAYTRLDIPITLFPAGQR